MLEGKFVFVNVFLHPHVQTCKLVENELNADSDTTSVDSDAGRYTS